MRNQVLKTWIGGVCIGIENGPRSETGSRCQRRYSEIHGPCAERMRIKNKTHSDGGASPTSRVVVGSRVSIFTGSTDTTSFADYCNNLIKTDHVFFLYIQFK